MKYKSSSYSSEKTPRLLTISASHYCEKVRWALEKLDFDYVEERHVPLFHVLANRKTEAGKIVPVLIIDTETIIIGAQPILQHLHSFSANKSPLYPCNPQLKKEVERLETYFEKNLAPLVAHWAYYYLLANKDLIRRLWCEGTPRSEEALFPVIFPLAKHLFKRKLGIKTGSVSNTYCQIKQIFENVNQRLAEGGTYLVGNEFSAADLTFSALAAPALLSLDYRGVRLPSLNEVPDEMANGVRELRAMPAGQYAINLFRSERNNKIIELI